MLEHVRDITGKILSAAVISCLFVFVAAGTAEAEETPATDAVHDFDRRIAPLLARRCLDCHNATDRKGGLDLTTATAATAGGDSGRVIEPGRPAESLLWSCIDSDEMPPKHPLSLERRQAIRARIEGGATWGSEKIDRFRYTTEARAGYDWWSLQPLVRPDVPQTLDDSWSRSSVDRFVRAELARHDLQPSAEADRRTLIRRVTIDLTGLPPTPEEIAVFLDDAGDGAYERVVDRLLASPQYGVRWRGIGWTSCVLARATALNMTSYGRTPGLIAIGSCGR